MAGLLVQWLDDADLDRTAFVGHSMGAQIGVHLAGRWPDRIERLVLTNAAGIPHDLSLPALTGMASALLDPRSWGRPSFLPTIVADSLRAGPRTLVRALRGILADDIRPLLPRITAPTLLLWGQHDPLTPVADGRLIQELIPDAELVVIPGASHNAMTDRPAAFNRALLRFLDGGRGTRNGADAADAGRHGPAKRGRTERDPEAGP
jgi:pimeloyl-ACP methyl ester carboxylesterase